MKKKGIQLSASFMVTLILAIVVFALGIGFFTDLFKKATEMKATLDAQTEKEIRNLLLTSGDKVAIPYDRKEIRKNKDTVMAIGIYNTLRTNTTADNFFIAVGSGGSISQESSCAPARGESTCYGHVNARPGETNIRVRKTDTEVIPIIAEANNDVKSGETYIFNVNVCTGTVAACTQPEYGKTVQFYIRII